MEVKRDNPDVLEVDCGTRPRVRPPWCRQRFVSVPGGKKMTIEAPGNDTDINTIVARFERTGFLPPDAGNPQYGDVTALQEDFTVLAQRSIDDRSTYKEFIKDWEPASPEPEPPPAPPPPAPTVPTAPE